MRVVRHQDVRLSYRQLWDESTLVARGLLARGIEPGDRVGIWASNRSEWVVVQYATARLGAVLVNVNPAYLAHELEYVLCQAGVKLLLHADGFRGNRYGPMLEGWAMLEHDPRAADDPRERDEDPRERDARASG